MEMDNTNLLFGLLGGRLRVLKKSSGPGTFQSNAGIKEGSDFPSLDDHITNYSQVQNDCEEISEILIRRKPLSRIVIADEAEVKRQYTRNRGHSAPAHIKGVYIPSSNLSFITEDSRYDVFLAIGHEEGHASNPFKQDDEKKAILTQKYWYQTALGLNLQFTKYSDSTLILTQKGIITGDFYTDLIKTATDQLTIAILSELKKEGKID